MTIKEERVCELRRCLGSVWGKGGVWLPVFPQLVSAPPSMTLAKNRGNLDMEAHMVGIVSIRVLCGMLMSCRNFLLHIRDLHLAEISISGVSRAHPIVGDISGLSHCFHNHCMSCFMEMLSCV